MQALEGRQGAVRRVGRGGGGGLTWPVAALAGVRSFGVKREFEDAAVELVEEREKVGFTPFAVNEGEAEPFAWGLPLGA